MKTQLKYAVFIISYLFSFISNCQNLRFQYLTAENGLSHNNTTSIIRDERGFVWIGTNFGLNRYNGNQFELFTSNSKTFNIINNNVTCLKLDAKGNLLIGTLGGLSIFFKNHKNSVNIDFVELKQKIEITEIFPFTDNILFVGTRDFLIIYDYNNFKIIKTILRKDLKTLQAMNFNNIWHFFKFKTQCYGIIGNHLYLINHRTFQFKSILEFADSSKTAFATSKLNKNGEIWAGGRNLLVKINLNTIEYNDYFKFLKTNSTIIEISALQYYKNLLFIGVSGKGVGILNNKNNFEFIKELTLANFAGANRISKIIIDKTGTIWITTDNGVLFSTIYNRTILQVDFKNIDNKNDKEIRCILKIKNNTLWIGTTSGIYEMDIVLNSLKPLNIKDQMGKNLTNICSIHKNKNNKITIGTSFGVYTLNKNIATKENFNINPNMLSRVWSIENIGSSYYISTLNNLIVRYDTNSRKTTQYITFDNNQAFFNCIVYKNSVYAGGLGSVYKWNTNGTNCRQYKICNSQISHILLINNTILVSTQNDGIFEIDTNGKVLKNYFNDGKFIFYRTFNFNKDKFISSTNKGILIFENRKKFMLLNTATGLAENTFNFGDIFYIDKDLFVFSSNHKLHKSVGELAINKVYYSPVIDKIRVDDSVYFHPLKTIIPQKIKSTHHIAFFTTWTQWLKNENNIEYLFFLGKKDEYYTTTGNEWIALHNQAGNYKLYLQNIFDNKKHNIINLSIKPVYYQSLWFRTLLILSIFAITFILIRQYISNRFISKKLYLGNLKIINTEKEKDKLELQALRSQMNPHFVFNTLSGIQTLIMQKKTEKAIKFLHDFSFMLRTALDVSSNQKILLKEEKDLIVNYLELHKLRYDNFKYKISIDKNLNENVYIPSMCIQPIVENCFKHAFVEMKNTPQIEINIEKIGETKILIKVWDNGCNFAYEVTEIDEKSIGLGNLKRRLKKWEELYKINADIKIEQKSIGKSINIELPIISEI